MHNMPRGVVFILPTSHTVGLYWVLGLLVLCGLVGIGSCLGAWIAGAGTWTEGMGTCVGCMGTWMVGMETWMGGMGTKITRHSWKGFNPRSGQYYDRPILFRDNIRPEEFRSRIICDSTLGLSISSIQYKISSCLARKKVL